MLVAIYTFGPNAQESRAHANITSKLTGRAI